MQKPRNGLVILAFLCANTYAATTNVASLASLQPALFRLEITISGHDIAVLRKEPRHSVTAEVHEGSNHFQNVAIHLKGSVGSFRSVDDKPGLTLSFSKSATNQTFHGSSKIHLNNSVEDLSYLNEKLGTIIFVKAGIPTPAVHHALVEMNGRRLGLYVLKEGFTPEFLARNFGKPVGNLYDNDGLSDVTAASNQDVAGNDRIDLKDLSHLAEMTNSIERWTYLQQVLDLPKFLTFMATEIMICHGDGYSFARNNYRIYHNTLTGKLVFLPHGMDQLFHRPNLPWRPAMAGSVAQAVMNTPDGQQQYRARLQSLLKTVFDVAWLTNEVDGTVAILAPALPRKEANAIRGAASDLKTRITLRKAFLESELARPAPKTLEFANRAVALTNWTAFDPPEAGALSILPLPDAESSLHIRASATTAASWRTTILLPPGDYRFEARVKTQAVRPLPFGKHSGATIRTVGQNPPQQQRLLGDHEWTTLTTRFTVARGLEEVQLMCELRASKGEAWFDRASLKVSRIDKER